MALGIGDLVQSEKFSGIGKILAINETEDTVTVGFFESPMRPEERKVELESDECTVAKIFEETTVHCFFRPGKIWRRARYASRRPCGRHLIIYSKDDHELIDISELHVLNLGSKSTLNPYEFLQVRSCDTPFFIDLRIPFIKAYVAQRSACKSLSSVLSSSVEVEPHQIAVVQRVLADGVRRYLLADEVGLGKTIEAGLIIREHVLQDEQDAVVLISVPDGLVHQWKSELISRFYLGDLLDRRIFVCSHEKLATALELESPTQVVLDEAHQISRWAWMSDKVSEFDKISDSIKATKNLLLLSGTPLSGNEKNFLAMLHLLSPENYTLDETGIDKFNKRLNEREKLGGLYQAINPSNSNESLSDIIEKVKSIIPDDQVLKKYLMEMEPLVDWLAPDNSKDRAESIMRVRRHLGENYRIHHRMLRNRRDDPAISVLFPGLAGANLVHWLVSDTELSIDQTLDAYREEHFGKEKSLTAVTEENFVDWLGAYLKSPKCIADRATAELKQPRNLHPFERDILEILVDLASGEQIAKDKALTDSVLSWLEDRPKGKVVVFCGDLKLADNVFDLLESTHGSEVERHTPPKEPAFKDSQAVKILVCDQSGEDGLNLHGGERLIVHYGVPLNFSQIEQRHGRVNRYSASIPARPVLSIVLLPGRQSYSKAWASLLNNVIKIFDRSVASLQYVLQEEIEAAWLKVPVSGVTPFDELSDRLTGDDGLLKRELQRVLDQEELNSLNEEVEQARSFAEALESADELAELQAADMLDWMCKGLLFSKKRGEVEGSFRLQFSSGNEKTQRTLVDVESFIDKCLTGIDRELSDYSKQVTALMSADRMIASHGNQVYPLRFGQPFVDTVYNLSREDTRGTCSAWLRQINKPLVSDATLYFHIVGFTSASTKGSSARELRLADSIYLPEIIELFVDEVGKRVQDLAVLDALKSPYNKSKSTTGNGVTYIDMRIDHEIWPKLEPYYPQAEWVDLVGNVETISRRLLDECVNEKLEQSVSLNIQIESVSAIILIVNA